MNSSLIKLFKKHGLIYQKEVSHRLYKVYDSHLDAYAIVSWDYDKYKGYFIVAYSPISDYAYES